MKTPAILLLAVLTASAAEPPPSAGELASELAAAMDSGTAEIRLRLQIQKPPGQTAETLQLRIRQRRTSSQSKAVYEVLWPKERKGEAVFLRQAAGSAATGTIRLPDGKTRSLGAEDALFGSDLTVADAMENFFAWKNQAIVGSEKVGEIPCVILESKPAQSSPYARVRSWIDTRRVVPLRVEKILASGKIARRIVTTRVVPDSGRQIPGDLKVENPTQNSQTLLDGSSIRHDVKITDEELTQSLYEKD